MHCLSLSVLPVANTAILEAKMENSSYQQCPGMLLGTGPGSRGLFIAPTLSYLYVPQTLQGFEFRICHLLNSAAPQARGQNSRLTCIKHVSIQTAFNLLQPICSSRQPYVSDTVTIGVPILQRRKIVPRGCQQYAAIRGRSEKSD